MVLGVIAASAFTAAAAPAPPQQDRKPPTKPMITSPRLTSDTTPTFRFAARDGVTPTRHLRYRCALDSPELLVCPARYTPRLGIGTHVLLVVALDRAGNRSPLARATIKVF